MKKLNILILLIGGTLSLFGQNNSILADGQLYKIALTETGFYKMDRAFLSALGVDVNSIDPRKIQLLTDGGGMREEQLLDDYIHDPRELPVLITGEADGSFDDGDAIFFFSEGANKWTYQASTDEYIWENNIYDTKNYLILKIGSQNGQRITGKSATTLPTLAIDHYDFLQVVEEDKINVFEEWSKTQGGGKDWHGDHFKIAREYTYNDIFNITEPVAGSEARLRGRMLLRAENRSSFNVRINNGNLLSSGEADAVAQLSGNVDNVITYAHYAKLNQLIPAIAGPININVSYPHPAGTNDGSEGWLDWLQLRYQRVLSINNAPLHFFNSAQANGSPVAYSINNANANTRVWDVSRPLSPYVIESTSIVNNQLKVDTPADTIFRQYVAFSTDQTIPTPEAVGKIENQNLHANTGAEMLIVYHPDFAEQVAELATHRANFSDLNVVTATVDEILTEFSCGALDPSAIRNYSRYLREANPNFKFILLFGDGSYDSRNIYGVGKNFIPVWEDASNNPINAYPSDDYYGIIEGDHPAVIFNPMTVSVGRLPVKTVAEAQTAIRKIINYETNPKAFGDWRNRLVFVGDDEDSSRHTKDANRIADRLLMQYPEINVEKIFLDAYPQVSTPGGDRYPAATEAFNNNIFKGVLASVYLGHGGSKGWAQERVLNISDILGWENDEQLPLFITATCSFAGFDDPNFTTAGEEVFLNPRGGAIALFTTTRAVYAAQNAILTERTLQSIYERPDGQVLTMGESLLWGKNGFSNTSEIRNARKFALLGDPAMRLAIPEYKIETTFVDEHDVSDGALDTLGALQRVTIKGRILDKDSTTLSSFNGIVYPTVFDKATTVNTLQQDPGSSPVSFQVQKNIIFKGRASVTNGEFSFTFVVPRDINYAYGRGKISYYAADINQKIDAAGSYDRIIIGGTYANAIVDNQGPEVEVYMNNESFIFGGVVSPDPTLLVLLRDDNGINVVGNSIGHDLEGELDEDTQNTLLLNDFYTADIDDFTTGRVEYPLNDLEEGLHKIKVKAWDVANNSAEGYTEFVVAQNAEIALKNVLNYPNPFSKQTCFQFDHNAYNQSLQVQVLIYTVSGRLVKTINQDIVSDGAVRLDNCISWNGLDDFGDPLARGVYLYKVRVRTANATADSRNGESSFEKLVILR